MAKLLVKAGCDVEIKDDNGFTAADLAKVQGYTDIEEACKHPDAQLVDSITNVNAKGVKAAIDNGAAIGKKNAQEDMPIHLAADAGDVEIMKLLLAAKADISAKGANEQVPLHRAATGGNDNVIKLLLENGADVGAKDGDKDTPLHAATFKGKLGATKLLLAKGAQINAVNADEDTPLHGVAFSSVENPELAQALVDAGADRDYENKEGRTAADIARSNGKQKLAEIMSSPKELLLEAAAVGNMAEVTKLLKDGVTVNARKEDKKRPLHRAALGGHANVIQLLLDAKGDVNAEDKDADTPLHCAASKNKLEAAKLLLAGGASLTAKNKEGKTPADVARAGGFKELADSILSA